MFLKQFEQQQQRDRQTSLEKAQVLQCEQQLIMELVE